MQLCSDYVILNIIFIVLGFYFLIKGSDWFVDSSSFFARKYNISEIIIGLTIVSIGTSLPELGTNIYASVVGENSISIGNVVGSNIANICLVLGVGGMLAGSIKVNKSVLSRDGILMIFSFILLFGLSLTNPKNIGNGGYLGRTDGIIFLILFVFYMFILFRNLKDDGEGTEAEDHHKSYRSIYTALAFLFIGLVIIFIGAKILVDNVVWCAVKLHIPQSIIAATVVAFGTSVPELAVTITGALKGKHDIALGNIIGSCIFNITLILGASLVIRPIIIDRSMLYVVIPVMIVSGILSLTLVWKTKILNRLGSSILLLVYLIFILYSISHMF